MRVWTWSSRKAADSPPPVSQGRPPRRRRGGRGCRCEDWGEPVVRHADLESQLRARHPGLATDSEWTAGWLTHSGDEAVVCLHVGAGGLSTEDADRVRRALHDWCSAAGVRRLTIRDTSRGDDSPELFGRSLTQRLVLALTSRGPCWSDGGRHGDGAGSFAIAAANQSKRTTASPKRSAETSTCPRSPSS